MQGESFESDEFIKLVVNLLNINHNFTLKQILITLLKIKIII